MRELAELVLHADGDVLMANLSGEVDLSNSRELEREIVEAVPNHARGMVLDLSGLTYMDSAGVRLLLTLASRFRRRGQRLALAVPDDSRIRRVLALAGADGALLLDVTPEAARSRMDSS